VKDDIRLCEKRGHEFDVANITTNQLQVRMEILRPRNITVDLRHECIDDGHVVPASQESVAKMGADESGSTSHQDALTHWASPKR